MAFLVVGRYDLCLGFGVALGHLSFVVQNLEDIEERRRRLSKLLPVAMGFGGAPAQNDLCVVSCSPLPALNTTEGRYVHHVVYKVTAHNGVTFDYVGELANEFPIADEAIVRQAEHYLMSQYPGAWSIALTCVLLKQPTNVRSH